MQLPKERLQQSGIIILVVVGIGKLIWPDADPADIEAVARWWREQDITLRQVIDYVWEGSVIAYIANRLREKKNESVS